MLAVQRHADGNVDCQSRLAKWSFSLQITWQVAMYAIIFALAMGYSAGCSGLACSRRIFYRVARLIFLVLENRVRTYFRIHAYAD